MQKCAKLRKIYEIRNPALLFSPQRGTRNRNAKDKNASFPVAVSLP